MWKYLVTCGKSICGNLVELPMNDFKIILCMDRLHKYYAFMNCRSSVLRFHFPNEIEMVWEGYISSRSIPLISKLRANKMMSKGLLCHIVSTNDLDHDIPSIDSVHVVNEFKEVFPDYLP